jgi:hypothetical protein
MINVLQFKYDPDGEYTYNVVFETSSEKKKIQTNDEPLPELTVARKTVTDFALLYFHLHSVKAVFRQITFSYPEKGVPSCVLEFKIRPDGNTNECLTLKSDKLGLYENGHSETVGYPRGFDLLMKERDSLVVEILEFQSCIEQYAVGNRAQKTLGFDAAEMEPDDEAAEG